MAVYLAKYFRSANGTLIKRMIPLFWQRGPGGTLETTFKIPSTDKHPFVALLSPFKSHGSFSLRARLLDVGKTQLPICRGCAMFANAKQRLKMRPHKLWRMDRLICFLAQALTAFFFFGGGGVFVSATRQLIMKPLSLLDQSTLMFRGLVGNRGTLWISLRAIRQGACWWLCCNSDLCW